MGVCTMRGFVPIAAAISALAAACAPGAATEEDEGASASRMFFVNSVRRDATAEEAARTAQLTTSQCAAFFIENTAGKTFVVTARHCVEFQITNWCAQDGQLRDNAGVAGRCTRIVAADKNRDIALFEANMVHSNSATLRLAAYVPAVGTKLVMTGYPADDHPTEARRGRLTTTDNCWVLSGVVESPHAAVDEQTLDVSAAHNCSTYGGNSGGPMSVKGKNHAIGLPFTYMPEDWQKRSATNLATASHVALMAGFVQLHRAALEREGIVIANSVNEVKPVESKATPGEPEEDVIVGQGESVDEPAEIADAESDSSDDDDDDEPAATKPARARSRTIATSGCAASGPTGSTATPRGLLLGFALLGLSRLARRRVTRA